MHGPVEGAKYVRAWGVTLGDMPAQFFRDLNAATAAVLLDVSS
jgi:hypothetical protein